MLEEYVKEKGFNIYDYYIDDGLMASIEISKDTKSKKDLFSVDCSIFKFGYDGKYIDLTLALGPTQKYINVAIVAIIRDIKDLFRK